MASSARRNPACPCGVGKTYETCCAVVHNDGAAFGVSAEALMRARYSGYVLEDRPFLLRSWHPDTRPKNITFSPNQEWLGLTIVDKHRGGPLDTEGTVEFIARFRHGTDYFELHELSTFERLDGQWVYKTGNDPAN